MGFRPLDSGGGGGGGGGVSFSAITAGTNAAALVVGTGGSLTVSGSGTINATSLGGTAAASYALLAGPTFTAPVTITGVVGSSPLTITGATQTASFPVLNLTQTWNNAGAIFNGLRFNVTNTASSIYSALIDLQVNAASFFQVSRLGSLFLDAGSTTGISIDRSTGVTWRIARSDQAVTQMEWVTNQNNIAIVGNLSIGSTYAARDLILNRDAARTHAWRDGTNPQRSRFYNTFTTVLTVGEWWKNDWITTANQLRFGTAMGTSTGTARVASWDYGGLEASPTAAITVPITSGAIVFGGGITTPGGATMHTTNTALTDGAGASAGTLGNAPAIGNPTKWIGINDNGTTRYIPAW